MVIANSNDAAKPLLAESGKTGPSSSVDGFVLQKGTNKLPKAADLSINTWSNWGTLKIPVLLDGMKPARVTHKGKTLQVFDYKFFVDLIRDWMRGKTEAEASMPGTIGMTPMTKEQALDLYFEIGG